MKLCLAICWIAFWIAVAIVMSGCQRTDYQLEIYKDGKIEKVLYISNTSWCTDSRSKKIVVDPNGLATLLGYGKQEDSIKAKALIGGVPVTVESVE